jgi:hypothetical protein
MNLAEKLITFCEFVHFLLNFSYFFQNPEKLREIAKIILKIGKFCEILTKNLRKIEKRLGKCQFCPNLLIFINFSLN